jgi:hypothetical protein
MSDDMSRPAKPQIGAGAKGLRGMGQSNSWALGLA